MFFMIYKVDHSGVSGTVQYYLHGLTVFFFTGGCNEWLTAQAYSMGGGRGT